jgi:hypothetical protein
MDCPLLPWEVRHAAQKQRETKIRDNPSPRPSVPRSGYPPQRYPNSGPTSLSGPPRLSDTPKTTPLAVNSVEEELEPQEPQGASSPKAQSAKNE